MADMTTPDPTLDAIRALEAEAVAAGYTRLVAELVPIQDAVESLLTRLERAEAENTRLREALRWALDYIADGTEATPTHDCDFRTNPEKGACDFHENYWEARAVLASGHPTEEKRT